MVKTETHHRVMYSVQRSSIGWGQAAQPVVVLDHPGLLESPLASKLEPYLCPSVTIICGQNPDGLRSLA